MEVTACKMPSNIEIKACLRDREKAVGVAKRLSGTDGTTPMHAGSLLPLPYSSHAKCGRVPRPLMSLICTTFREYSGARGHVLQSEQWKTEGRHCGILCRIPESDLHTRMVVASQPRPCSLAIQRA